MVPTWRRCWEDTEGDGILDPGEDIGELGLEEDGDEFFAEEKDELEGGSQVGDLPTLDDNEDVVLAPREDIDKSGLEEDGGELFAEEDGEHMTPSMLAPPSPGILASPPSPLSSRKRSAPDVGVRVCIMHGDQRMRLNELGKFACTLCGRQAFSEDEEAEAAPSREAVGEEFPAASSFAPSSEIGLAESGGAAVLSGHRLGVLEVSMAPGRGKKAHCAFCKGESPHSTPRFEYRGRATKLQVKGHIGCAQLVPADLKPQSIARLLQDCSSQTDPVMLQAVDDVVAALRSWGQRRSG